MRINKFLALCNLGSRRKCEEFVLSGKVKVNGEYISSLSFCVDEKNDMVFCNDKLCVFGDVFEYVMFNKPKGCLCTRFDSKGRKTIYDYLNEFKNIRLFSVGRLDFNTEGLLILTNDGDLANYLTHPKFEIEKTYIAKVEGEVDPFDVQKLRDGVVLDDGFKTAKAQIELLVFDGKVSKFSVIIHEGKNRQVRRMFEAVGKNVIFLKRTQFASLKLGGLERGRVRKLSANEINLLKNL